MPASIDLAQPSLPNVQRIHLPEVELKHIALYQMLIGVNKTFDILNTFRFDNVLFQPRLLRVSRGRPINDLSMAVMRLHERALQEACHVETIVLHPYPQANISYFEELQILGDSSTTGNIQHLQPRELLEECIHSLTIYKDFPSNASAIWPTCKLYRCQLGAFDG